MKNINSLYLFYLTYLISFLISFSTTFKYFCLFSCDTNGTDQNCFVLNHLDGFHPNTNVYTPITNLNLTELRYRVTTGNAGAPCVIYVLTFLSFKNGFGYAYLPNIGINLYANPGVKTSSKNVSIFGVILNHHTGEINIMF